MPLSQELIERALHDPTLHYALTRYERGEWTLEHALTQAALNLSAGNEKLRASMVEMLSVCTCRTRYLADPALPGGREGGGG